MSRNTRARGDRDIYCGNNALNYDVVNGNKLIGTRYQCFKKGVGAGLKEPILQPLDDYAPIDQTKIYCGKKDTLPPDKDRFGTSSECLRKGFGVGQKIKFDREGVQQTPIVLLTSGRERPTLPPGEGVTNVGGWYKVFLPTILGPVAGVFGPRNRKLWANPCLFEVPYSGSGQKTGLNAVDAVSNQAPLVSWTGQVINIAAVVVSAIDDTVVVSAAANSFSVLDNFYQGAELQTPLGTSFRIDSNSFISQSGGNDYVQFDVTGSGVKAGDAVTIQVTAVPNTLFVPNGSELANAYVGDYLYNETQGQWVLITGYDELLHKVIAPIPGGWAATDAYSIRRELPVVGNFAVGAGNTPTTLNLLGVGIVVEPGSFVRRLTTGEIVSVASFDQLTGIATVSPPTSTVLLAGELVEVLSQSYDNYKTLSYAGTTVGQHEQVAYDINLVSCTVPNLEIINGEGGYPADYPFLYIELQDTNHPSQNNICSNAVSNKSYFKATTPTGQLLNRQEKFTKFTGDLSHKTVRFRPTSNFRIAWRLPSGEEIKFREQDAMSPTVPKAALQVSAHFNLERN